MRGELEKHAKIAAKSTLGPGNWIRGVVEPFVYFTAAARELPEARRQALEAAIVKTLEAHAGIAQVVVTRNVASPCPDATDASLDALVCRSLPPGSGEALHIVPRPGSFFDPNLVAGHGINHGTPYLYDRSVPVFVRAPDRALDGTARTTPIHPPELHRNSGCAPAHHAAERRAANGLTTCSAVADPRIFGCKPRNAD